MFTTTDKTLVSWFCFDEEAPKHCVQAVEKYDALAFGQDAPGKWSTASDDNTRTQTTEQLAQNPKCCGHYRCQVAQADKIKFSPC